MIFDGWNRWFFITWNHWFLLIEINDWKIDDFYKLKSLIFMNWNRWFRLIEIIDFYELKSMICIMRKSLKEAIWATRTKKTFWKRTVGKKPLLHGWKMSDTWAAHGWSIAKIAKIGLPGSKDDDFDFFFEKIWNAKNEWRYL